MWSLRVLPTAKQVTSLTVSRHKVLLHDAAGRDAQTCQGGPEDIRYEPKRNRRVRRAVTRVGSCLGVLRSKREPGKDISGDTTLQACRKKTQDTDDTVRDCALLFALSALRQANEKFTNEKMKVSVSLIKKEELGPSRLAPGPVQKGQQIRLSSVQCLKIEPSFCTPILRVSCDVPLLHRPLVPSLRLVFKAIAGHAPFLQATGTALQEKTETTALAEANAVKCTYRKDSLSCTQQYWST